MRAISNANKGAIPNATTTWRAKTRAWEGDVTNSRHTKKKNSSGPQTHRRHNSSELPVSAYFFSSPSMQAATGAKRDKKQREEKTTKEIKRAKA